MIVVEGPDGSGKTTLIKRLVQLIALECVPKAVSSEMNAEVDLSVYIEKQLNRGFGPRLYDRFALISGPIYGPLFGMRPPNDIFQDFGQLASWLSRFYAIEPLVIYCLPHHERVAANLWASEDFTNRDQVENFMQAYWSYKMKVADMMNNSDRHAFIYDYEHNSIFDVIAWVNDSCDMIGWPRPETKKENFI